MTAAIIIIIVIIISQHHNLHNIIIIIFISSSDPYLKYILWCRSDFALRSLVMFNFDVMEIYGDVYGDWRFMAMFDCDVYGDWNEAILSRLQRHHGKAVKVLSDPIFGSRSNFVFWIYWTFDVYGFKFKLHSIHNNGTIGKWK